MKCVITFTDRGKWKKRKEDLEEFNDDDSLDDNEASGVPDAAKNDVEKQDETALEDEFGAKDYRSQMVLKPDCASRPLWVVGYQQYFLFHILQAEGILFILMKFFFRHQMDISF